MWTPFGIAELPLHPHPTDLDPRGGGQFYLRVDAGKFTSDAVRHSLRCRTSQAPAMGFSAVPRRNIQYQDMKMILCVPRSSTIDQCSAGLFRANERCADTHNQGSTEALMQEVKNRATATTPSRVSARATVASALIVAMIASMAITSSIGSHEPATAQSNIFNSVLTIAGADVSSLGFPEKLVLLPFGHEEFDLGSGRWSAWFQFLGGR